MFYGLPFRRVKEKYEKEIRDLETAESQTKNKYCEVKTKLLEYEENIIGLKGNIKILESQVHELQGVSNVIKQIFLLSYETSILV